MININQSTTTSGCSKVDSHQISNKISSTGSSENVKYTSPPSSPLRRMYPNVAEPDTLSPIISFLNQTGVVNSENPSTISERREQLFSKNRIHSNEILKKFEPLYHQESGLSKMKMTHNQSIWFERLYMLVFLDKKEPSKITKFDRINRDHNILNVINGENVKPLQMISNDDKNIKINVKYPKLINLEPKNLEITISSLNEALNILVRFDHENKSLITSILNTLDAAKISIEKRAPIIAAWPHPEALKFLKKHEDDLKKMVDPVNRSAVISNAHDEGHKDTVKYLKEIGFTNAPSTK